MSAPLHCCTAEAWFGFSNSWCLLSGNDLGARVKREQPHLLLYKQLASPLICFLFYVMIALMVETRALECLGFSLMGGLYPFRTTSISCGSHMWLSG